jgi:hypothetical protein
VRDAVTAGVIFPPVHPDASNWQLEEQARLPPANPNDVQVALTRLELSQTSPGSSAPLPQRPVVTLPPEPEEAPELLDAPPAPALVGLPDAVVELLALALPVPLPAPLPAGFA